MSEQILNANEALLAQSLAQINRRIASLISSLSVDGNNRFLSDAISLQSALEMRVKIAQEFVAYDVAVSTVLSTYTTAAIEARDRFAALDIAMEFTQADADLLNAIVIDTRIQLEGLSLQTSSKISQTVYMSVVAGSDIDDITLQIEQYLIGKADKAGKPMSNHAATIAETQYMEVDSTITKRMADSAGVERFRYSGSLISDSRQWCVNHVGKVFTLEQIKKWEGQSWKGKRGGDPLITRGGWRCRHHWQPIA